MMKTALILTTLMFMGYSGTADQGQEGPPELFVFDTPDRADEWLAVNDRVMGGVSRGQFRVTESSTLEFHGTLSLENNGGFASIRSSPRALSLRSSDTFHIRLRGDGRTYFLNLYVKNSRPAFSFRAAIQTTANEWLEVRVPVQRFQATWFGRQVDDPLEIERVNSLGFMVSDGIAGPFRLEIQSIQVTGS
jgi:NADH dehydrogenase [ubiquinone] 1 alpha subcomplex assembly factor 1